MRGRSVTRREGDNTQGAGKQVLAFAVSFLGWCGADAQTFQKFRASGSSLRHPRSLLIAQLRLDVSPSAWGFPQGLENVPRFRDMPSYSSVSARCSKHWLRSEKLEVQRLPHCKVTDLGRGVARGPDRVQGHR